MEGGRLEAFVKERNDSFDSALGRKVRCCKANLSERAELSIARDSVPILGPGKQEYPESALTSLLFGELYQLITLYLSGAPARSIPFWWVMGRICSIRVHLTDRVY